MPTQVLAQRKAVASTRLYRAVWRWHFYARLFVIPFLIMLAFAVIGFLLPKRLMEAGL
jgi:uncharacterized iron-regulated membrane protein